MDKRQEHTKLMGGSLLFAGAMLTVAVSVPFPFALYAGAAAVGAFVVAGVAFDWLYLGGQRRAQVEEQRRTQVEERAAARRAYLAEYGQSAQAWRQELDTNMYPPCISDRDDEPITRRYQAACAGRVEPTTGHYDYQADYEEERPQPRRAPAQPVEQPIAVPGWPVRQPQQAERRAQHVRRATQ